MQQTDEASAILLTRNSQGATQLQEIKNSDEFLLIEPIVFYEILRDRDDALFLKATVEPQMTNVNKDLIDIDIWMSENPSLVRQIATNKIMDYFKSREIKLSESAALKSGFSFKIGGLDVKLTVLIKSWSWLHGA
jgi:hypothetical protein